MFSISITENQSSSKYKMDFRFISTFHAKVNQPDLTITVGYNQSTPKMIKLLNEYKGDSFIHSGNWWNIKPETRTREVVLEKQEQLWIKGKTIGFMSCNIPASFERADYWNMPQKARIKAIEKCLENADWALEHVKNQVPIYCSLEVCTHDEARKWFREALDRGHTHFCRGVAEFLSKPKYRKEGLLKVFEIVIGARSVLGDKPFHLSGTASPYLMPIFCYLGVSSIDGSTPVTSALGRGTVYDKFFRGHKVREIKEWSCDCSFCSQFSEKEVIKNFNEDNVGRMLHNLELWKKNVKEIQECHDRTELRQLIENRIEETGSKYLKRQWERAIDLLTKLNHDVS